MSYVPASSTISTSNLVSRNSSGNFISNNITPGYTATATAAGTTTLTVTSTQQQFFTGSTTQTVVLPVVSTLSLGMQFRVVNLSSGVVTVQSSGLNTLQAMAASSFLIATVISTSGTGTASWNWVYQDNSPITLPLSLANGGTSASLVASNGGVFYSTGSAGAILAGTATANKVLMSGSTAAPTWSTPTFPNASATSRKIIVSDGTNWVASTETWAVPGTSGNVLTSNGTNWTSAAPASSGITTINGNSGSATGSTVTITTGASNANGSAKFTGSGSTVTLTATDATTFATSWGSASIPSTATGTFNSAFGINTLTALTNGASNCAFGNSALTTLTQGNGNAALGNSAGRFIITGINGTYLGAAAGSGYTNSESYNICIGHGTAGTAGESNTLRIGLSTGTSTDQLNQSFIAGIQGITVTGTPILISSSDQLGIAVSSKRFKENIVDMCDCSKQIRSLRPVNFTVNRKSAPGLSDASQDIQYGLIAEEVHDVMPYLCYYDKEGNPLGVKYDQLPVMLLSQLQKALKRIESLEAKLGV